MTGVNLKQFQFDQDLSFAVMFLNSDGTVYGKAAYLSGVVVVPKETSFKSDPLK